MRVPSSVIAPRLTRRHAVIASEAEMIYAVRAPSSAEVVTLIPRFLNCFRAAALATGCEIAIERDHMYMDVRPATGLETYFNQVSRKIHQGEDEGAYEVREPGFVGASTDFVSPGPVSPAQGHRSLIQVGPRCSPAG